MERYPRIYDHVYYLELNCCQPELNDIKLVSIYSLLNPRCKKKPWYKPLEFEVSCYAKAYNKLCDTEKLLETMKDELNNLTKMASDTNHKLPLVRRIIIAISKRKTSTKIEKAELTCKQLEKELDRLINTDVIQKKRKRYREENPWPEGFI